MFPVAPVSGKCDPGAGSTPDDQIRNYITLLTAIRTARKRQDQGCLFCATKQEMKA